MVQAQEEQAHPEVMEELGLAAPAEPEATVEALQAWS